MDSLLKLKGDSLAVIAYHSNDPFSGADGNTRLTFYSPPGVPTSFFNGTESVVGGWSGTFAAYLTAYNHQIAVAVPCTISLVGSSYDRNTHQLVIKAKVTAVDTIPYSSLRLRMALTETDINYSWGGLPKVNNLLRDMLPDAYGYLFTIRSAGQSYERTELLNVITGYNDEKCEIIIFVQHDFSKKVLVSKKFKLTSFGDLSKDNTCDIQDAIILINYVFYSGPAPHSLALADVNNDCLVDIGDITYLINYLFYSGEGPKFGCAQ